MSKRRALKEPEELKHLQKLKLVRRRALVTIASAWIINVPAAALLSEGI